ncbi:MAG: hypothetical protein M1834_001781 [Cirrosporium novae-zelandiae]|nr:MAG: hypothetical protein M1834_001781 [Cirrosporium novae-zelandiae]
MAFVQYHRAPYGLIPTRPTDQASLYANALALSAPQLHPGMDGRMPIPGRYDERPDIIIADEMEEYEITTRPRLDKKQAARLEKEFQDNPKPNSAHKKKLAFELELEIPRVNNWFQNRRAKAKQDKKREEFELANYRSNSSQHASESSATPSQAKLSDTSSDALDLATGDARRNEQSEQTREACYTFENAISAMDSAPSKCDADYDGQTESTTAPGENTLIATSMMAPSVSESSIEKTFSDWGSSATSSANCTPILPMNDPFCMSRVFSLPMHASPSNPSPINPDFDQVLDGQDWLQCSGFRFTDTEPTFTDPMTSQSLSDVNNHLFPMSFQRHPSYTEELALDFNGIEIDSKQPEISSEQHTPIQQYSVEPNGQSSADEQDMQMNHQLQSHLQIPNAYSPEPLDDSDVFKRPEGHLDIAARRKRPRPAALGPAALRSRSFGPNSLSPTGKGYPMPGHSVRRIKSTGHSLNVMNGRVQKSYPGSSQRSPLATTFQSADALDDLLTPPTTSSPTEFTIPVSKSSNAPASSPAYGVRQPFDPSQMGMLDAYSGTVSETSVSMPRVQTPPVTPHGNLLQGQSQCLNGQQFVPLSAPPQPQYANFQNYTPPYSAGLPTDSSWPDAPLTSPEFHSIPPTINMPQPSHISSVNYQAANTVFHDNGTYGLRSNEQAPHFSSDNPQAIAMYYPQYPIAHPYFTQHEFSVEPNQKPMEIQMQEFPNQKENHAFAAKQLAGEQKPRSFVFSNSTADDFGLP